VTTRICSTLSQFPTVGSARAQVGWRDADADGVYDVIDTLSTRSLDHAGPGLPALHLAEIDIDNTPALPDGIVDGGAVTCMSGIPI
jgi:hypothetical protein